MPAVAFEILGEIGGVETIAVGHGIRDLAVLERRFGRGNWRKLKGFATVLLHDGTIAEAELHWYEAHGTDISTDHELHEAFCNLH